MPVNICCRAQQKKNRIEVKKSTSFTFVVRVKIMNNLFPILFPMNLFPIFILASFGKDKLRSSSASVLQQNLAGRFEMLYRARNIHSKLDLQWIPIELIDSMFLS